MNRERVPELLTTTEAAALLGVGTSSVKRWADAGLLPCVKTAGSHRRFERAEVERWRARSGAAAEPVEAPPAADPAVDAWLRRLLAAPAPLAIQGELLLLRARLGAWWSVADFVGQALVALGEGWRRGEVGILEEHVASEGLSRALARVAESLPEAQGAPRALLLTAEGEEHTLGLGLAELVLREGGWSARWAGRRTPVADAIAAVGARKVELVALSASLSCADAEALGAQARLVEGACRESGTALLLGGEGSWPGQPGFGHRVHSFRELAGLLAGPLSTTRRRP